MEDIEISSAWIKASLSKRHQALVPKRGRRGIIKDEKELGPWTTLEEFGHIDFLAISATKNPPGTSKKISYPRIGYEVKISRGDLRTELLNPRKRRYAREICHQFFLATPENLLKKEEKEFEEPDWKLKDFKRPRCPKKCQQYGKLKEFQVNKDVYYLLENKQPVICSSCQGKGYLKSKVEEEGPTLWIPKDVGLIEIDEAGFPQIIKNSPIEESRPLTEKEVGQMVRFVSARPDPRHKGFIEERRQRNKSNFRKRKRRR